MIKRLYVRSVLLALFICVAVGLVGCSNATGAGSADNTPAKAAAETKDLSNLVAHFIDVGQGDSELIQLPNGKIMLIDAGNSAAGETVVEQLEKQNVQTIDYLVATHPHADHIGGMTAVLEAFDVREIWMPDATTTTETYGKFLDAVEAEGAEVHQAKAGELIVQADAGYTVDVLAPGPDTDSSDLNDYSAIIKVTYGQTSFLFTGDAPAQTIVDAHPGNVNVLKAAHHGSKTGTTEDVINELRPDYIVMSYKEGNDYGHPDQEVLDVITQGTAQAYSTAAHGTVTATSDGKTVTLEAEKDGTITAGVSAAEREAKEKAEEERRAQETAAAEEAQRQREAEAQAQKNNDTVYITPTGSKYHKAGCRTIKSSSPISRSDAIAKGYTACRACNP